LWTLFLIQQFDWFSSLSTTLALSGDKLLICEGEIHQSLFQHLNHIKHYRDNSPISTVLSVFNSFVCFNDWVNACSLSKKVCNFSLTVRAMVWKFRSVSEANLIDFFHFFWKVIIFCQLKIGTLVNSIVNCRKTVLQLLITDRRLIIDLFMLNRPLIWVDRAVKNQLST
jgi:hypothetical protein